MGIQTHSAKPGSSDPNPKHWSKNIKRVALIEFLMVLLAANVCAWAFYLTTHKPLLAALPLMEAATKSLHPHYLFSINGIQEPVGVAATSNGERIYVVDSGGERMVHVFDRDGNALFNFAPPNSQPFGRAPVYIALDGAGQVYVSDRLRHAVDIYDEYGKFKSTLKPPTTDGWAPLGVRSSGSNLLFTDVTNGKHRVLQMSGDGHITLQFGRQGNGVGTDELWFPNSMVVDAQGRAYVSDSNNARIQVIDQSGNWLSTLHGFSLPRGMAIDEDQRLYIVDGIGQLVRVFDVSGDRPEALFDFGDYGARDGEFNYPNDITVDKTGRLYIADRASNRLQVWAY